MVAQHRSIQPLRSRWLDSHVGFFVTYAHWGACPRAPLSLRADVPMPPFAWSRETSTEAFSSRHCWLSPCSRKCWKEPHLTSEETAHKGVPSCLNTE